jgi:hypothetical protein
MSILRRPAIALPLLLLTLPITATANSIGFQTNGGQITSNGTALSISNSRLSHLSGVSGAAGGNLGWASLTTGSLLSGSLASGATFAAGGSFTLTGSGAHGIPAGVIFGGSFLSPATWTATFNPDADGGRGAWYYALTGVVRGTLSTGRTVRGRISFSATDVPRGAPFSAFANLAGASGQVVVPEPSTLALLASGLGGLAILVRRKRKT